MTRRKNIKRRSPRAKQARMTKALKKYLAGLTKGNPARVRGRKTKGGGRSVTLKNFTGTVTKKGGAVVIRGKGKR